VEIRERDKARGVITGERTVSMFGWGSWVGIYIGRYFPLSSMMGLHPGFKLTHYPPAHRPPLTLVTSRLYSGKR